MELPLKIKLLTDAEGKQPPMPKYATEGSAAFDLTAFIREPVTVAPGGLCKIPTGIALEVPEGYAAFVFARSGLGIRHGICLSNGVGVIDSDYRGEIAVGLCNVSGETYQILPGDRIAQVALLPVWQAQFIPADTLSETKRNTGGFGSTGR